MDVRTLEWIRDADGDAEAAGHIDAELKARIRPFSSTLAKILGPEGIALSTLVLASASSVSTEQGKLEQYVELTGSPVIHKVIAAAFMLGIATQLEDTNGS